MALATFEMGSAYFLAASSRGNKQAAIDLAEAGLDYAFWQVKNNHAVLPYTANVSLNTGAIQITAVDDSLDVPTGMLVTSTATRGAYSYTAMRVMSAQSDALELPYAYLWCQDANISSSAAIHASGGSRGMRCNGNINLSNAGTSVSNGAWATGTITTTGSISPQYPGSIQLDLPQPSADYYRSIATETHAGGDTISSLQYHGGAAVVYVSGSCTLSPSGSGKYNGVVTIYAEGVITIMGDLRPQNGSCHIAVISGTGMVVNTDGANLQAVLYASNGGTGYISIVGNASITGCIAADSISTVSSTITLNTDSSLDTPTLQALHLPGV